MDNSKLYNSIRTGEKISWREIYKNEEELLRDLKNINPIKYRNQNYKGYIYITSFIRELEEENRLSNKQITQAKRLARYIKLYNIEQVEKHESIIRY